MINKEELEGLFAKHGFADFKWMRATEIRVAQWVRIKCLFGCAMYGKRGTCPPNVPDIDQCRQFFSEYEEAAIFHLQKTLEKPDDYRPWSREAKQRLLDLEREVFLTGYYKAFLVSFEACGQCDECAAPTSGRRSR